MSNDYVVVINSNPDINGESRQYVLVLGLLSNHGISGEVLWDERIHGEVRAYDAESDTFYYDNTYSDWQRWEGRIVKKHGGINNSIPYLDPLDDFIPNHETWVLNNYRKVIPVWELKATLHSNNELTAVNTAIEATYLATPLNKVRWEEREMIPFGGILYDLIYNATTRSHSYFHELWEQDGERSNEFIENEII